MPESPVPPLAESSPIALVDDERFDAHEDPGGHHPECPERLAAARSGLFHTLPADRRMLLPSREAADAELCAVHDPRYVRALDAALQRAGGRLDPDTFFNASTREAAWLAAGGAASLAQCLVEGRANHGVALLRPPGHHAEPHTAMGFCMLNNVAIGARAAQAAGAKRIAIVDWDVHHGNGTQRAFYTDPNTLFISLHQYPFYPGTGSPEQVGDGAGTGTTANLGLPGGSGPEAYGHAFRQVVLPLLAAFGPDLLLVSAGFDAHRSDPLAGMELDTPTFGALTSALLGACPRVGFVLEGGYDLAALESSVAAVGRALSGRTRDLPEGDPGGPARNAIARTLDALAAHHPALAAPEAVT